MAQPFAWLALLLIAFGILASESVPVWRKQIVVAHLDVHLRNFDRACSVIRYVEVDVERAELLEL